MHYTTNLYKIACFLVLLFSQIAHANELEELARNVQDKVKQESEIYSQIGKSINSKLKNKTERTKSLDLTPKHLDSQMQGNQSTEGFYIAVSLSMPGATLINLYESATKVGGKLIIRGLINNSFKDTIKVIGDKFAVDVNPMLFRKYNIQRVPTFIIDLLRKSFFVSVFFCLFFGRAFVFF